MKATLTISMDNAAFGDDPAAELARILRDLADRVERVNPENISVRDANGNKVGELTITDD